MILMSCHLRRVTLMGDLSPADVSWSKSGQEAGALVLSTLQKALCRYTVCGGSCEHGM